MSGEHVERPARLAGGQTYCSCGLRWPCKFASSLTIEQLHRRCVAALKVAIADCEDIGWCGDCALPAWLQDGSGTLCPTHEGQFQLAEEFREALLALGVPADELTPVAAKAGSAA